MFAGNESSSGAGQLTFLNRGNETGGNDQSMMRRTPAARRGAKEPVYSMSRGLV